MGKIPEENLFNPEDIDELDTMMEIIDFTEVVTVSRTHINDEPMIHIDTVDDPDVVIALLSAALQFMILATQNVCGGHLGDDEDDLEEDED